jgi:hypothetical protein
VPTKMPSCDTKGYSRVNGCRSDPTVCIMLEPAEGMAESLAGHPQLDVGQEQGGPRPYDLRPTEVGLQTCQALRTPVTAASTEPYLRNGLE